MSVFSENPGETARDLVLRKFRQASPTGRLASEDANLPLNPSVDDLRRLVFQPPAEPQKTGAALNAEIATRLGMGPGAEPGDDPTRAAYKRAQYQKAQAEQAAAASRNPATIQYSASPPVHLSAEQRAAKLALITKWNRAEPAGSDIVYYLGADGHVHVGQRSSRT